LILGSTIFQVVANNITYKGNDADVTIVDFSTVSIVEEAPTEEPTDSPTENPDNPDNPNNSENSNNNTETRTDGSDGDDTNNEKIKPKQLKTERYDPLALDLNKDGFIETYSSEESTAYFDITGDGIREKIGWIKDTDALLVYDKNGGCQPSCPS